MTVEAEITFMIQNACKMLGGAPLDVQRHKAHAEAFIRELAARLPAKDTGTDAQIAEQVMMALVENTGAPERRMASHQSYAKLFAAKFSALLRAELNKTET